MARTITVPEKEITQDISHYIHHPGISIVFYVGRVWPDHNGDLQFIVPQQFETIKIEGDIYSQFIADHLNGFTKDDLWQFAD